MYLNRKLFSASEPFRLQSAITIHTAPTCLEKIMKNFAAMSLFTLCASYGLHAHAEQPLKLNTQVITADASHLTTRIEWVRFPQIKFTDRELMGQNRVAVIRVRANEAGKVTDAEVKESTGIKSLDQKIIAAVLKGKTKPYIKNKVPLMLIGYQVFSLNLDEDDEVGCSFDFSSKNWLAQHQDKKTAFQYLTQPTLSIHGSDLNGHNRMVKFSFKVDRHGHVKSSKILKGSGIYRLDQQVLTAVNDAQVDVPRKYWIYKKSKLKNEITFNLDQCD